MDTVSSPTTLRLSAPFPFIKPDSPPYMSSAVPAVAPSQLRVPSVPLLLQRRVRCQRDEAGSGGPTLTLTARPPRILHSAPSSRDRRAPRARPGCGPAGPAGPTTHSLCRGSARKETLQNGAGVTVLAGRCWGRGGCSGPQPMEGRGAGARWGSQLRSSALAPVTLGAARGPPVLMGCHQLPWPPPT